MNKYIEVFCKQNPEFSLICDNPTCNKKHIFKSKDVFKAQSFKFKCIDCGATNVFNASKFIKDFETQMKKIGIVVKQNQT